MLFSFSLGQCALPLVTLNKPAALRFQLKLRYLIRQQLAHVLVSGIPGFSLIRFSVKFPCHARSDPNSYWQATRHQLQSGSRHLAHVHFNGRPGFNCIKCNVKLLHHAWRQPAQRQPTFMLAAKLTPALAASGTSGSRHPTR